MAQSELQVITTDLVAYFEHAVREVAVLDEIQNAITRNASKGDATDPRPKRVTATDSGPQRV